jgi:hypothetical protein
MVSAGILVEDTVSGKVRTLPNGQPVTFYQMTDHDAERIVRGVSLLSELLFSAGARRIILPFEGVPELHSADDLARLHTHRVKKEQIDVMTVHVMGTARMGNDRTRHVCDGHGKVYDTEGLYVADASLFPTSIGVNPMETIMALATRNAERAGVADGVQLRGGDALQRMPPAESGVMLVNPPYGERIEVAGVAGGGARGRLGQATASHVGGREQAETDGSADFFAQLATHWKKNYAGWTAWVLTPDLKLPGKMRLKESRRVPMWNGPLECRLFKFDMVAGRMAKGAAEGAAEKPSKPAA